MGVLLCLSVHLVSRGQKVALDPLTLELQTVVSYHVGAGKKASRLFGRSANILKLVSHLSRPPPASLINSLGMHFLSIFLEVITRFHR